MIDWLYRRRDPAAAGATVVLMAISVAVWRHVPHRASTPPPVQEMVVRMEDLPPEPPPAPPPPPPPPPPTQPPPPPTPTPPTPSPAPPRPAPAATPEATPAPSPAPAPAPSPAPPEPAPPTPAPPAPAPPAPVAPPAPPPAPTPPVVNANARYTGLLREQIKQGTHYPTSREASQLHPEGTVRVWIEIDRSGQLLGSGVEAGSGSSILDSEGLRTVRLRRYEAIPPEAFTGESFHRFVVPIEFRRITE